MNRRGFVVRTSFLSGMIAGIQFFDKKIEPKKKYVSDKVIETDDSDHLPIHRKVIKGKIVV